MVVIKIELLDEECMPIRMNEGDACYDLRSRITLSIPPQNTVIVPVGIKTEIPLGYHAAVSMRSGLAKRGIMVANGPGIIDSYYRDEWGVIIFNSTNKDIKINKGDRIAQFRIIKNVETDLQTVKKVSTANDRGGGFGSTGVK